jgi:hypothetical protein
MHTLSIVRRATFSAALAAVTAVPAAAQSLPSYAHSADLSGPRFGLTLLSDGIVEKTRRAAIAGRPPGEGDGQRRAERAPQPRLEVHRTGPAH